MLGIAIGLPLRTRGSRFLGITLSLTTHMTVPPTAARKRLIDTTYRSLTAWSGWTKTDCLFFLAAHDGQAGRVNWKSPGTYDLSVIPAGTGPTSPTFVTDRGWTGAGAGATAGGYLASTFNPATAPSPKFVQDSAHQSVSIRTASSASSNNLWRDIGAAGVSYICAKNASAANMFSVANAAAGDLVATGGAGVGHFAWSRLLAANYHDFFNGTDLGTTARVSTVPSNAAFTIGKAGGGYSDAQYMAASWGGGLTAQEVADLRTIEITYLTAVGAL